MANDPRKPMSWKNPQAAAKGPATSQKREWHPTTPTAKSGGPKRRSVLLPALVGAVLLGLIVVAILMLRPPRMPRLVVVAPADIATLAIPHNVTGANGAKSLAGWAEEGRDRPRLAQGQTDSVAADEWTRGIDEGKEDAVVVYFGLHGGVNASGPFLWLVPPESDAPTEKHQLRIASIIERLAKLPEDKHKLLILDAAHVPASYVHGQLHNDFARALKSLDAEIAKVPNLVVICSADEDQRSWLSEEWQQPIFTHLLIEGAKGACGYDRVTAERLFEFLKREVPAWTRANRGEEQVPFLLPSADGLERAKKIEVASVSVKRYAAPTASSAPGTTFEVPSELAEAWHRRDALAAQVPSPQAVAPYQWRRHLDSLIRAEQMHRAGASSADVLGLLSKLRRSEGELSGSPWPELSSMANALPMPAALGAAKEPTLDSGRFLALFADPINEWPKLRDSVSARGATSAARLPLDVCALLLDHLIREDRAENIAKAAKLLDVVFGPAPAPVEAHLIRILNRDLAESRRNDWPRIKQALQLHRLAQETALVGGAGTSEFPASEQVYPWIKEAIAQADVERLKGIDLLISSDAGEWSRAGEIMSAAADKYRAIQKQAAQVRESMAERNTVLAELPYYGRWVAGLRDEFDPDECRRLLERIEKIADTAHRLSTLLEQADAQRLNEMHGLAGLAKSEMQLLRETFFRFIARLNADVLISRWHHIDNALQVPFIPAKRRVELLTNLRTISSSLNQLGKNVGETTAAKNNLTALETAQRHGRIALALLGSAWVNNPEARDASGGAVRLKFDDLKQRIISPKPNWWESLNEAGEQIGWHWRYLATRADALAEKSARGQLDEAIKDLARADTLARSADSATNLGKERDPVTAYRRHRLHDFLIGQARRMVVANWADADVAATQSYADVTAARFINDAEQLIMMSADRNPSPEDQARLKVVVTQARQWLPVPRCDVQPDEMAKDLTDQQKNFPLKLTLTRPGGLPPGYPMLRLEAGGPAKSPINGRQMVRDFAESADAPMNATRDLVVEVDPQAPNGEPGFLAAELWHRGHRISKRVRVELNTEPSSIWVYKPPKLDATVAVRAGPDLRAGAVAILLDWSYSMVNNPQRVNRYDLALRALREVMSKLPPDTIVSLMQFGDPAADDTGQPPLFLAPKPRNFKNNPSELEAIMKELGRNQPRGKRSPIARAIARAAEAGLPQDFTGYRAIVVLTDGEDTVDEGSAGDVAYAALVNKGIDLKLIFFQTQQADFDTAKNQFSKVQELEPPAEFLTAADQLQLAAHLNDAMLPRVQIYSDDGQRLTKIPALSRSGLRVTGYGSNLINWSPPLAPGPYRLRSVNSVATPMTLDYGDRLLLELYRQGSRVAFRPRLYLPDLFRDFTDRRLYSVSGDAQRIHAGLADCKLVANGEGGYDLDLLLMMERERRPEEMQVTRPRLTWVEVRPQEGESKPGGLRSRLENELYMPTPSYRIRVFNWPAIPGQQNPRLAPSRPAVNVWWSDSIPRNPTLIRRDEALSDFVANRKPFRVDGKEVRIDSVRFEGNYLLLQISHTPGPPVVFVRAEELKDDPRLTLEEEHRFYEKSGKYTVRFGPLSEAEKKRRFTLVFLSMEELKRDAVKIELTPRMAPDVTSPLGQATPRPYTFSK